MRKILLIHFILWLLLCMAYVFLLSLMDGGGSPLVVIPIILLGFGVVSFAPFASLSIIIIRKRWKHRRLAIENNQIKMSLISLVMVICILTIITTLPFS